jgi:hypothetical protein
MTPVGVYFEVPGPKGQVDAPFFQVSLKSFYLAIQPVVLILPIKLPFELPESAVAK